MTINKQTERRGPHACFVKQQLKRLQVTMTDGKLKEEIETEMDSHINLKVADGMVLWYSLRLRGTNH